MRTSGRPSASTVASAMASGSLGSDATASANHAANSANGSGASVKSPDVNWLVSLMSEVLFIRESRLRRSVFESPLRSLYRANLYRARLRVGLSAIRPAATVVTAILVAASAGGCSLGRNDGAFAQMAGGDATGSIAARAR